MITIKPSVVLGDEMPGDGLLPNSELLSKPKLKTVSIDVTKVFELKFISMAAFSHQFGSPVQRCSEA